MALRTTRNHASRTPLTRLLNTRRPGHRPRDVDTTDQKYKQKDGHAEKFHEKYAAGEPGLVCWRSGRRARSCGAPALVSAVSNTQAQPNAWGRGAHLQQQVTKALVRDGLGGC